MKSRAMRIGLAAGLSMTIAGGDAFGAMLNQSPMPVMPLAPPEPVGSERDLGLIKAAVAIGIVAIAGAVAYRVATKGGKVKGKVKKGNTTVEGMVCTNLNVGDNEVLVMDPLDLSGAHTTSQSLTIQGGETSGMVSMTGGSNTDFFEGGASDALSTEVTFQGDVALIAPVSRGDGGLDSVTLSFNPVHIAASITATDPVSFGRASFSLKGEVLDENGIPMADLFHIADMVEGLGTDSADLTDPFVLVIPGTMFPAEVRGGSSISMRLQLITQTFAVPGAGTASLLGFAGAALVRRRRLAA